MHVASVLLHQATNDEIDEEPVDEPSDSSGGGDALTARSMSSFDDGVIEIGDNEHVDDDDDDGVAKASLQHKPSVIAMLLPSPKTVEQSPIAHLLQPPPG